MQDLVNGGPVWVEDRFFVVPGLSSRVSTQVTVD